MEILINMCSVGVWSFLSICARLVYGVPYKNMCSVGVWSFL
jgi:hypothetical protein